eukprot:CAMPEP_0116852098 /NCGR_PEP_ID=MMETSP0418-20121206/17104_1 /TAXON_ID=1158023 /ORGANISM="Astrosyne radiata, Strain 13vi08-1A" /LENGTH=433 /DNA_ID=CAMNT_0004484223 /DNA_START=210 /DNA_END=1511 /DNA_ORIENTATION=+
MTSDFVGAPAAVVCGDAGTIDPFILDCNSLEILMDIDPHDPVLMESKAGEPEDVAATRNSSDETNDIDDEGMMGLTPMEIMGTSGGSEEDQTDSTCTSFGDEMILGNPIAGMESESCMETNVASEDGHHLHHHSTNAPCGQHCDEFGPSHPHLAKSPYRDNVNEGHPSPGDDDDRNQPIQVDSDESKSTGISSEDAKMVLCILEDESKNELKSVPDDKPNDVHNEKPGDDKEPDDTCNEEPEGLSVKYYKDDPSDIRLLLILLGQENDDFAAIKDVIKQAHIRTKNIVKHLRMEVKRRTKELPKGQRVSPSNMNKEQLDMWLSENPVQLAKNELSYFRSELQKLAKAWDLKESRAFHLRDQGSRLERLLRKMKKQLGHVIRRVTCSSRDHPPPAVDDDDNHDVVATTTREEENPNNARQGILSGIIKRIFIQR